MSTSYNVATLQRRIALVFPAPSTGNRSPSAKTRTWSYRTHSNMTSTVVTMPTPTTPRRRLRRRLRWRHRPPTRPQLTRWRAVAASSTGGRAPRSLYRFITSTRCRRPTGRASTSTETRTSCTPTPRTASRRCTAWSWCDVSLVTSPMLAARRHRSNVPCRIR